MSRYLGLVSAINQKKFKKITKLSDFLSLRVFFFTEKGYNSYMEKVILKTIEKYNLLQANSTVIVAVSGGADSMALLHFLNKELPDLQLVVAHVNHQKRPSADLDEELVKKMANRYGLPYEGYDLPENKTAKNFQQYGRDHRYDFFKSVAASYYTNLIATAHHGDDHLETIMYRLLTQNMASGLIGIEPATYFGAFKIIRPLIEVRKEDIYRYCHQLGIAYREDDSNQSDLYARNRIRKYIIPTMTRESLKVYEHVRMISDGLREDEAYFNDQVDQLMKQVQKKSHAYQVPRALLQNLPRSLSRRLVKRMLQGFTFKDVRTHHLDEVLKLAASAKPNLALSLPHQISCMIAYEEVIFFQDQMLREKYEYELPLNSRLKLPINATLVVSAHKDTEKKEKNCMDQVCLCYNGISLPLKVRTRQTGERMPLINREGSKKVKELMIEAKIPRHLREQWPIITDAKDQIIWIPLVKKSAHCLNHSIENKILIQYLEDEG